jgi:hypothetical protein
MRISVAVVCRVMTRQMVEEMLAWSELHTEMRLHALLFLFSYSFLLRTPSEALPAVVGFDGCPTASNSMVFKGDGESLVLVLRRRKNKPEGSRLVRKCSCGKHPATCAYHLIGKLVDGAPAGTAIFGSISPTGPTRMCMCMGCADVRRCAQKPLRL